MYQSHVLSNPIIVCESMYMCTCMSICVYSKLCELHILLCVYSFVYLFGFFEPLLHVYSYAFFLVSLAYQLSLLFVPIISSLPLSFIFHSFLPPFLPPFLPLSLSLPLPPSLSLSLSLSLSPLVKKSYG